MTLISKTTPEGTFNPNYILERSEFFSLPRNIQRELMLYWRDNYSAKKIRKHMGYENGTAFYNLLKRLEVPTNLNNRSNTSADTEYSSKIFEIAIPASNEQQETEEENITEVSQEEEVQEQENTVNQNVPKEEPSVQPTQPSKDLIVTLKGAVTLDNVAQVIKLAQDVGLEFTFTNND